MKYVGKALGADVANVPCIGIATHRKVIGYQHLSDSSHVSYEREGRRRGVS
jgi:hypothetical protein